MSRLQEQRDRLYAETEELQTALLNGLKDVLKENSPISAEEAQEWVEKSVFFDSSATAKMSRLGVSIPQFKESLAELYRYLGGKLGIIYFVVEGRSKRAFARGRGLIALQGAINTETLFHECGHLAEAWDQAINAACLRFVKDRAEGPPYRCESSRGIMDTGWLKSHILTLLSIPTSVSTTAMLRVKCCRWGSSVSLMEPPCAAWPRIANTSNSWSASAPCRDVPIWLSWCKKRSKRLPLNSSKRISQQSGTRPWVGLRTKRFPRGFWIREFVATGCTIYSIAMNFTILKTI